MNEQLFQVMREEISDIKKDVKELLAFKWTILAYATVVSAIIGGGIQIFILVVVK